MRPSGTTYAVSLNLAHDRARRDQRVADAWRRRHADAGIEATAPDTAAVHGLHWAIANLFGALVLRRMRPTRSTQARP